MRKATLTLSIIAALSGLTAATNAQLVVWSTANFTNDAVGPYGTTTQFGDSSSPTLNIVDPGTGGPGSHAMELVWNQDGTLINFQSAGIPYPASGNTNVLLQAYTLEFDMQVIGVDAGPYPQGLQISIFGPGGGVFGGPKVELDLTTNVFAAGQGYQHYAFTLDKFVPRAFDPTTNSFTVGFGIVSFGGPNTAFPNETFDIANLEIVMDTAPPPPPHPTIAVLPAKPGLRIFSKNFDFTYNQSGFGTVDASQSWVGATPSAPKSYAITIGDFDTVDNYTLYSQFVPNGSGGNPFGVFGGTQSLVWRITHVAAGFTTGVDWKTNAPNAGETNNALTLATTSTNGRGTWNLTFTNDTDGTVTAPDGTSGSFSLPPDAAALFADPLVICFGTAPNNTGGYGQHITINRLTITNVAGVNVDDDFTTDDVLNTSLWNPAFSYPPGTGPDAVVQVSTNAAYWVNWTIPDDGMGLGTKADLANTSIPWKTPNYYGGGTVTNTVPSQMGPSLKWTLIPSACLPTVDGTVGGPPSTKGFFGILRPAPAQ